MVYPWTDAVEPADESDIEFDVELQALACIDTRRAVRAAHSRRIFYRTGAPRLGERFGRGECGRGTGHFGSGLYFFGTLSAALGSAAGPSLHRRAVDYSNLRGVYRVIGGPDDPRMTWSIEEARNVHEVGKALLCFPGAATSAIKLKQEADEAFEEFMRLRYREPYNEDVDYWELERTAKELRGAAFQASSEAQKYRLKLEIPSVFRLDLDLHRARSAINRSEAERKYHPMTYYMRSLGFDGIVHGDWEEFNSGDRGNIWYPEV